MYDRQAGVRQGKVLQESREEAIAVHSCIYHEVEGNWRKAYNSSFKVGCRGGNGNRVRAGGGDEWTGIFLQWEHTWMLMGKKERERKAVEEAARAGEREEDGSSNGLE